jgi:hypothetical protein
MAIEPISAVAIAPEAIVVTPLAPLAEVQVSSLDPRTARN